LKAHTEFVKERIASLISTGLVDNLEPVDIQEKKHIYAGISLEKSQTLKKPVDHQTPVRKPRQGIIERKLMNLVLSLFLPGYIILKDHNALDFVLIKNGKSNIAENLFFTGQIKTGWIEHEFPFNANGTGKSGSYEI
jgi:hypothetical protein